MSDLFRQFIDFIEKKRLIGEQEHVLVAVSGGVDSVVLFDLLWQFAQIKDVTLGIVHLNHSIRGNQADEDQLFVQKLADKYSVPFHHAKVNVPAFAEKEGYATEEAARILRYRFFENILQTTRAEKIALGHHADDQVETVLLHFFRGSGTAGLAGMKPRRGSYIRPLLFATRKEIENYAKSKGLDFRLDSTNLDVAYKRNRVRHELLPYLRNHFNTGIDSSLLRTQKIMSEIDAFLQQQAAIAVKNCTIESKKDKIILEIDTFLGYFIIIQKYMIFRLLEQLGIERFSLSSEKLERIIERIQQRKIGKKEILPQGVKVSIDRNTVVFQRGEREFFEKIVALNENISLPNGSTILKLTTLLMQETGELFSPKKNIEFVDWEKVRGELKLRTIHSGDRFFPLNLNGSKKVSDFLSDLKVELHRRKEIPVLECDSGIIWLVGFRIDDRFKVTERTKILLKMEIEKINDSE
ncbi:tRNA lysidine(34) synthetase TilS [candidate division KSB1 bacterium 4484_87]|nr:MAG: tRNA lysidine(34) synthetase TilS [candidate division KSB1 bacterium 4484_87]